MGIIVKKYIAIAFIVGIVVGFFLNQQEDRVIVKEVKGDTIKEVIHVSEPITETIAFDLKTLPRYVFSEITRVDTITNTIEVDTLAIINAYIAINKYNYTLFHNEHGKLDIEQEVQFDRIKNTAYTYTPIKRVESKLKRWQLLVGAGYNTDNYIGPSVGIIYKDIGIIGGYKVGIDTKNSVVDIGIMYRL